MAPWEAATGLAPVTDASAILGLRQTARGCHVMRKRRSDDPRKWLGMSLMSLRLLSKAHRRNSPSSIRASNAHLLPSCETLVQNALTTGTRYKANKDAILTWLTMVCYHLRCTSTVRVSLTEGCADKAADNANMSSVGYSMFLAPDRTGGMDDLQRRPTRPARRARHCMQPAPKSSPNLARCRHLIRPPITRKGNGPHPRLPPSSAANGSTTVITVCVSHWRAHRLPQDLDTLTLYPEAHGQNLHGKIYRNIGCSSALWCRGEIRTARSGERLRRHHQRKDFCRRGGA